MQPLPTKNTYLKRRLIREPDEEKLEVEIEEQPVPSRIITLSEEVPKKACKGRPEKNMQAKTSAAEPSELNAFIPASSSSAHATQAGPSITVTEFDISIEALPKNELIFKRTYKKSVSIESDIRTHIGMQTRENEDSILTLHQLAENTPSSNNDKKKILEVPIGIEAVNQYKKDNGDFLKEDRWHNWKKTAKKVLLDQAIHTTRATHGGRHTGTMEAEALVIPLDLIKRGGGWKDPGYWDKLFGLARNGVSPPIELQIMIFPWIESYFGEKNAGWVTAYEREMQEVYENEDEDGNIIDLEVNEDSVEFVEEDGRMIIKEKQKKGKQRAVQSSMDTAKRGFLRLLIRCRRINLQDAAVYMYLNKENKHVNSRSRIFSSNSFKMFQEDIVAAITSPSVGRLEEYEGLVLDLVNTHKQVASRVAEVNRRLLRLQKQQDDRFEKSENSFNNFVEQNNHSNLALMNMTQQLAKNLQFIMMQQQCLNSQMQLLMTTNTLHNTNLNTSLPQASTFPATVPTPFSTFSFPPPPPSTHHPVAIYSAPPEKLLVAIQMAHQNQDKKKAKWVSHEPSSFN
ncbi:hypothetical protein INT46_003330 [Mucor plumbeus]|uniref:Ndc10 domain-containing protein n=1 Tax=Mucor plumbeus TaxID=97098 RepID=A0A8H7R5I8_9FUNG|nr:hypothetical protein INT46_003330 [Mucor plumbeus]